MSEYSEARKYTATAASYLLAYIGEEPRRYDSSQSYHTGVLDKVYS